MKFKAGFRKEYSHRMVLSHQKPRKIAPMCIKHVFKLKFSFCFTFIPGAENNFKKYPVEEINSRGVEYDYGSLMHYSKYQGNNRPGVQTMESVYPDKDFGQRKGPSKLDIEQARLMYKCDGK